MEAHIQNIPPPAIVQTYQVVLWGILTIAMFIAWWSFFARRLQSEFTLSERLLSTFIATVTQVLGTILLLGTIEQLFWWPLGIFNGLITGFIFFKTSKLKTGHSPGSELVLVFKSVKKLTSSSLAVSILGVLAIFLGCWMTYIGYLLPTWCFDSWNVTLPWASYAHQEGHLGPFIQPNEFINAYPMNTECLFLWWIIGHGSINLANISQAPFMFAAMLASYIIARNVGARKVDSAIAALLVISVPMAFQGMWITKNDLVVMGLVLSAMAFLSKRNLVPWSLILAGCASGFVLGSKGPFYLIGLTVFLILRFIPGKLSGITLIPGSRSRKILNALVAFIGFTLLLGSTFYLRNWIFLGNPMGIFEVRIGPLMLFPGVDPGQELFKAGAWGDTLHEQMQNAPIMPFVIDGFFDPSKYQFALTRIGGWGPVFTSLFLPAIPLAFVWCVIRKKWILPAIIIGLALPLLFYKPVQLVMIRYHLQMVGAGAVAFAFIISTIRRTRYRNLLVALAVMSMVLSISLYGPPTYGFMLDPSLVGEMRSQPQNDRDRFVFFRELWDDDEFLEALVEVTQPGSTIAYTVVPGTSKMFALWNGTFSNRVEFISWTADGDTWTRDLFDSGAGAVLVGNESEHLDWAISHPQIFVLRYHSSLGAIFILNK